MRHLADEARIVAFVRALGRATREPVRLYLTGGATAVLQGWRVSTIDIDIHLEPDSDLVLREIPALKERLSINIELASPADFIPELRQADLPVDVERAIRSGNARELFARPG